MAALALALLGGAALGTPPGQALGTGLPRVTVIGDSVATSLEYTETARAVIAQGVDLRLELAPCRRVKQVSCPYDGVRPPTVVDLATTLGDALGQTVVVAVGYNDYVSSYADDIEAALAAFRKVGVTRVIWLTLHEARPAYATMNDAIRAAAARHPEVTVADWQRYSAGHPDWFQPDGIHLQIDGAVAMATLTHSTLEALGVPVATAVARPTRALTVVASRLPVGVVGRSYSTRLVARGGTGPFRWARVRGRLPAGLRLLRNGRVQGVPVRAGTVAIVVKVTDARRATATRRIVLRVRV